MFRSFTIDTLFLTGCLIIETFVLGWLLSQTYGGTTYFLGIYVPYFVQVILGAVLIGFTGWFSTWIIAQASEGVGRQKAELEDLVSFLERGVRITVYGPSGAVDHFLSKSIAGLLSREGAQVYIPQTNESVVDLKCRITGDVQLGNEKQKGIAWEAELIAPDGLILASIAHESWCKKEKLPQCVVQYLANSVSYRIRKLALEAKNQS